MGVGRGGRWVRAGRRMGDERQAEVFLASPAWSGSSRSAGGGEARLRRCAVSGRRGCWNAGGWDGVCDDGAVSGDGFFVIVVGGGSEGRVPSFSARVATVGAVRVSEKSVGHRTIFSPVRQYQVLSRYVIIINLPNEGPSLSTTKNESYRTVPFTVP